MWTLIRRSLMSRRGGVGSVVDDRHCRFCIPIVTYDGCRIMMLKFFQFPIVIMDIGMGGGCFRRRRDM